MMDIRIKDFLSLKNIDFSIKKGITVIAGKNGSGKSQLLLGIAHNNGNGYTLTEFGHENLYSGVKIEGFTVSPEPELVLYRQPVRQFIYYGNTKEYTQLGGEQNYFSEVNKTGFSYQINSRFTNSHSLIASFFNDGQIHPNSLSNKNMNILVDSFKKVFNKTLDYSFKSGYGGKIGLRISNKLMTSYNTLSTGELEFIGLLYDLLRFIEIEKDGQTFLSQADMILIDELDAHFHPDLQTQVIDTIAELCSDRYVLITTHSPSVMMSVDRERVFFIKHFTECENKQNPSNYNNQISLLNKGDSIYSAFQELNSHFFDGIKMENIILHEFASNCMKESPAISPSDKDSYDPQVNTLRDYIQVLRPSVIAELGCGEGRTVSMFQHIDDMVKHLTYIGLDIKPEHTQATKEYIEKLGLIEQGLTFIERIGDHVVDLYILANVLHEISPVDLIKTLNDCFKVMNKGGRIAILENQILPVGEKQYVMFYPEAIKKLLFKEEQRGNISLNISDPFTYNKTHTLMNALVIVKNPTNINVSKDDILSALDEVIYIESQTLLNHYDGNNVLSIKEFAFRSHNLAHAQMFKYKFTH